jgi:hypothetical protein
MLCDMTTIAIMNQSSVLSTTDLAALVAALQVQVDRDWQPAWGSRADLVMITSPQQPPSGAWWLTVFDTSDQAGALGYHDLTNEGLPLGKIFALTDKQNGNSVTVTASHELLEILADPDVNLCAQSDNTLWAYEVCDPVESDSLGYEIDGVLVSDFVLPAYFESFRTSGPFDYKDAISAPLTLAKGGYLSYLDFSSPQGWQQKFDEHEHMLFPCNLSEHYAARARVGSRRERRRTPHSQWIRSRPVTG